MTRLISQKGVALIAVLWVTAFLATIASTVAHQSRSSLQMTKNRIEMLKVNQAAESAMLLTIADLINAPELESTDTGYQFSNNVYKNINTRVSLQDESGKIDLNNAPTDILQGLFLEIGLDETEALNITNAILDWRDEDNQVRVGGAEDAKYRSLGYAYESKDRDFERIEELKLIHGMSPALYAAISPYITVYTQDFGVNLSVAPGLVRNVVRNTTLISEEDIDKERDALDVDDDEEFTSLTQGYIYTIKVDARGANNISQNISAIIRIDRGNVYEPFTILKWSQI